MLAPLAPGSCADEKPSGTPASGDGAGISIEGIKLFNGEKGLELWRLKATWGYLSQEGDNIDLDKPSVRYAMGDPAAQSYLYVHADRGRIFEGQSKLRIWGNVLATYGKDTASSPTLTYDSNTRTMRFPDGVVLKGPSGSATMKEMAWELDVNRLTGEGDVNVVILPKQKVESSGNLEPQKHLEQTPPLEGIGKE